jgi:hypothetical protein
MLSIVIIAAYMVAFLCNEKSLTLLFSAVCCEFIGWSPLFTWTHNYYYGMLNFIIWGVIYALYVLLEDVKGRALKACALMVLFQFAMSIDSRLFDGAKTNLYILYEYILVLIHCYIISAFISRGNFIKLMGSIYSVLRAFCNRYVLNLVCWYTVLTNQKTKS